MLSCIFCSWFLPHEVIVQGHPTMWMWLLPYDLCTFLVLRSHRSLSWWDFLPSVCLSEKFALVFTSLKNDNAFVKTPPLSLRLFHLHETVLPGKFLPLLTYAQSLCVAFIGLQAPAFNLCCPVPTCLSVWAALTSVPLHYFPLWMLKFCLRNR